MELDNPSQEVYIKEVCVEALHGQFDAQMTLEPGLNVVYGKNGRGKTTMLHLLANLLELDFHRFRHLQFQRVYVATSAGHEVEIEKDEGSSVLRIAIDGSHTQYGPDGLSPLELTSLRQALGGRSTYLPAFRSVLERTRGEVSAYYRYGERRTQEMEELQKSELAALKEVAAGDVVSARRMQEEAASVADKTLLCRQWFGSFVPMIRYPSISDVEDALGEEWRRAQFEVTAREQRMFEETFVRVFRVSAGLEDAPSDDTNEGILQEISSLLQSQELSSGGAELLQLNDALLKSAAELGSQPSVGINRSLLEIYRKALLDRDRTRRDAFKRTREFESSVNRFLDKKQLAIGGGGSPRRTARSVVSVTTEAGQSYGLSALSSGERQIVTMLYSASRTRYTSGVFLVDEPELSLHIDWQRIILNELTRQAPDRQIIVCTHSPEVGAEHLLNMQEFEPKATQKKQGVLFDEDDEV